MVPTPGTRHLLPLNINSKNTTQPKNIPSFFATLIFSLTLAEYPVLSNVLQDNDFRCSLCSDASFVFHWYFINFMGCSIVHFLLMTYF